MWFCVRFTSASELLAKALRLNALILAWALVKSLGTYKLTSACACPYKPWYQTHSSSLCALAKSKDYGFNVAVFVLGSEGIYCGL